MKKTVSLNHILRCLGSLSLVVGLGSAPIVANAADQCKDVKWRAQHYVPTASSSWDGDLIKIRDMIEKRTEGRVKIEPFPAGALFSANQIFDAVSRNVIEMGQVVYDYVQSQLSSAVILPALPFTWKDTWEAQYFYKYMGYEDLIAEEAAKKGVFWITNKLYPAELVSTKPIESLADFESLKVRSSGNLEQFLTKTGASATYVPGNEIYMALSSGVVDAAHWGAAQGALTNKLYESAKYHYTPTLSISADATIINQKALDSLCAQDREAIKAYLEEHFWARTNQYIYLERLALGQGQSEYDVQLRTFPDDVVKRMNEVAKEMRDEAAKQNPISAKAADLVDEMHKKLNY
ncbi:TRAP transporter substrate-binding protein DctP [Orrella sp. 11846]|uniref:TRAP transporter substrate-binding protein DctP n=1 Tax=Orrella sp. 11846 TaxID=3409913 RepID=UPI003B5CDD24